MTPNVHRPSSAEQFLRMSGDFLGAREAEHNLLLGLAASIQSNPELFADDPPRFSVVTDDRGRVLLAGLRTPPHNQILSQADDPAAVDAVAMALADEDLPGVLAPTEIVDRFVERWRELTGRAAHLEVAERIFRLDAVIPPARPARGTWRPAATADRDMIARWITEFTTEALPESPQPDDPLGTADRWIAGIYRRIYLWEDDGRVVSMVGAGGETPNGIRIGPVYTPPAERGRGYATSLTAAASADQLQRGRRFCFLFTDLANPTSNSIYQAIGYRPVCDMDQYRFD